MADDKKPDKFVGGPEEWHKASKSEKKSAPQGNPGKPRDSHKKG